ncbi:BMC domain-containing protein [Alkalibaculum sp. M08DMB]|uniref:BMC domain-containing protein n=1 Tax=Alkalibaculum sporogenes TaxID=2655001 RepID=A0A6A7K8J1_9FIRM|nr:BMC domain-containing protein [Alkalibaculum sporogenes]MPW25517.1 BMC domain-containing protein [Alkalibaculum sporogenes]
MKSIGFVELNSIAKGVEVADQMLKTANVELIFSTATCPGKYIILIHGDVTSVENSIKVAKEIGSEFIIDDLMIPNVDEQIFPALLGTTNIEQIHAIGVIESLSMASLIVAADVCIKKSDVKLLELRLGSGIGGKSYFIVTGDVAAVRASIEVGIDIIKDTGNLVYYTVIPSPHKNLKKVLL